MANDEQLNLKYPIGKFVFDENNVKNSVEKLIKEIEEAPLNLRKAVEGLNEEQLNTQYRENGWTVKQVVHHVSDSHMNAYIRFKLSLTEDEPKIKGYIQNSWAILSDTFETPASVSLDLLEALHKRWVVLLKSLSFSDLEKNYIHPDLGKVSLYNALAQYAWHGKHHIAHITSLRKRKGWK